jgi:Right handed beta helix region
MFPATASASGELQLLRQISQFISPSSGITVSRGHGIKVGGIWAAGNARNHIHIEPNPKDPPDAVSDLQINGGVLGSLNGEVAMRGISIYSGTGLQVRGVRISNIISVGNQQGFLVKSVTDIQLQRCLAYRNGQEGFHIDNAAGVVLKKNRAIENGQSMANQYSGFRIKGTNNLLESNQANDNRDVPTQRYGFEEGTGSDSNTFAYNVATGNASGSYLLVGPYSIWR